MELLRFENFRHIFKNIYLQFLNFLFYTISKPFPEKHYMHDARMKKGGNYLVAQRPSWECWNTLHAAGLHAGKCLIKPRKYRLRAGKILVELSCILETLGKFVYVILLCPHPQKNGKFRGGSCLISLMLLWRHAKLCRTSNKYRKKYHCNREIFSWMILYTWTCLNFLHVL